MRGVDPEWRYSEKYADREIRDGSRLDVGARRTMRITFRIVIVGHPGKEGISMRA